MTHYWVAGLVIESAVPLPELPPADPGDGVPWSFCLSAPLVADREIAAVDGPDDDAWGRHVTRDGGRWALLFPDVAEFMVDPAERRVECRPAAGADAATVRHLFLDHLVPRIVAMTGDLVLHASAVATTTGAIAFLGASGSGKSSLAASFASEGYPLLTDDFLSLREADGAFVVTPSYPGLRLWPDAIAALAEPGVTIEPVTNYNDKGRLAAAGPPSSAACPPLVALFLLGGYLGEEDPAFTLTRAPGQVAFLTVLQQAFRLSPGERSRHQPEFERIARLLALTEVLQLCVRPDFEMLPQVRGAILERIPVRATERS